MSGITGGVGLPKMLWKCSANLAFLLYHRGDGVASLLPGPALSVCLFLNNIVVLLCNQFMLLDKTTVINVDQFKIKLS